MTTVKRTWLPTLQNRVYDSRKEAREARHGLFELQACSDCGYAWNAAFDPGLMQYDGNYDNSVPSPTFLAYYREIARYLHDRYLPQGGLVVDAGCGKGTFLTVMTGLYDDVRGLGIDPSCEAADSERLTWITDIFRPQYLREQPALLICRHTLEHVQQPVQFLRSLREPLAAGTPMFIEVPDTGWILDNTAFWDFCYEHVNYFNAGSAAATLTRAGITPTHSSRAFGDQYLWLEGVAGEIGAASGEPLANRLAHYAAGEAGLIGKTRQLLLERKARGDRIAIWGMATKGTEFVELVDPHEQIIDFCIDINMRKQGRYTPLSACLIQSPAAMDDFRDPVTVVVMNPNYLEEIRADCLQRGVNATFISF